MRFYRAEVENDTRYAYGVDIEDQHGVWLFVDRYAYLHCNLLGDYTATLIFTPKEISQRFLDHVESQTLNRGETQYVSA